ncbi:MAG: hypothetical protein QM687_01755 [Ferruginibacter sp.]
MDNPGKNKQPENSYPENVEYPSSQDIYNKDKKEGYSLEDEAEEMEENLDVPGAELDNADELIGEEDEENNYYSLGGDNHEDLEETNDDLVD